MRSNLLPVLVAGVLGLSGAAFAATTTVGTIKSYDAAKHTITLDDGITFTLPANYMDPGLKAGEKVSLVWDMVGSTHQASAVTIQK